MQSSTEEKISSEKKVLCRAILFFQALFEVKKAQLKKKRKSFLKRRKKAKTSTPPTPLYSLLVSFCQNGQFFCPFSCVQFTLTLCFANARCPTARKKVFLHSPPLLCRCSEWCK
jgi:hypothetical protein